MLITSQNVIKIWCIFAESTTPRMFSIRYTPKPCLLPIASKEDIIKSEREGPGLANANTQPPDPYTGHIYIPYILN